MTLLNKYPLITSIPIAYYNKTGSVDFDVLVFTKNSSLSTPVDYHVAWQVLRGETSVHFNYPLKMQVGARFYNKGQKILCGPHDTNPGTTWEIIHKRPDATPELIRGIECITLKVLAIYHLLLPLAVILCTYSNWNCS